MIKKLSSKYLCKIITDDHNKGCLLKFISSDTKGILEKSFSNDEIQNTFQDIDKLQTIWKSLLIDSIFFLRINDSRERAFLNEDPLKWDKANKTTMESDGVLNASKLNTYGIEELYNYFQQFTEFETTLYGTDKYYRDHVQHPLYVWLIGLNILNENGKNFRLRTSNNISIEECPFADPEWNMFKNKRDNTNDDSTKNNYDLNISTAELAAMWTISSLTHDIGYPLEKVDRVNEQLEKMLNKFGKIGFTRSSFAFNVQHDHLIKFLLNIISSTITSNYFKDKVSKNCWYTHISPKYFAKFSKSWEMFEHGIVSSLILLRSLTYFLETDLTEDPYKYLDNEDERQLSISSEI